MQLTFGNLLSNLPASSRHEVIEPLVETSSLRLERIVSTGQATPAGQWLVQDWDEWVVLLAGEAKLLIEGESAPRAMRPDDWIVIPAGVRHRVEWTSAIRPPCGWLCTSISDSEVLRHPPAEVCYTGPASNLGGLPCVHPFWR